MSKITFLGVWMTPDVGETVSFTIEINNHRKVLIDCGVNLVSSLISNGIDPSDITDIFITHSHGDHISGLPTYLFYRLLIAPGIFGKSKEPFNIIGSETTLIMVKKYIEAAYGNLVNNPSINYVVIKPGDKYSVGETVLELFKAEHEPETIGFKTYIDGKHIVYSGDTALSESVMKYAQNADILIHDVVGTSKYSFLSGAHTICKDISPMLQKYNVKSFYPVHRLSIYKDDVSEYYNELTMGYKGFVKVPVDGDVIDL